MLIFGGVTREGNRRARRAARAALAAGLSVVWFDGYEEIYEGPGTDRVPLDAAIVPPPEGGPEERSQSEAGSGKAPSAESAPVVVVGYAGRERRHPLLRMLELPHSVARPYLKEGSGIANTLRRLLSTLALVVRKKVLRRISLVLRGVIGWLLVRADVETLAASAPEPVQIVFGDDASQTQAWHAARIWPQVPTGMELHQQ